MNDKETVWALLRIMFAEMRVGRNNIVELKLFKAILDAIKQKANL